MISFGMAYVEFYSSKQGPQIESYKRVEGQLFIWFVFFPVVECLK